jgi:hypothetical protein
MGKGMAFLEELSVRIHSSHHSKGKEISKDYFTSIKFYGYISKDAEKKKSRGRLALSEAGIKPLNFCAEDLTYERRIR